MEDVNHVTLDQRSRGDTAERRSMPQSDYGSVCLKLKTGKPLQLPELAKLTSISELVQPYTMYIDPDGNQMKPHKEKRHRRKAKKHLQPLMEEPKYYSIKAVDTSKRSPKRSSGFKADRYMNSHIMDFLKTDGKFKKRNSKINVTKTTTKSFFP